MRFGLLAILWLTLLDVVTPTASPGDDSLDTTETANIRNTSSSDIAQSRFLSSHVPLRIMLSIAMAIPDDVLHNDTSGADTQKWMAKNARHVALESVDMHNRSFFSCAITVGAAIVALAIPPLKILQLKRAVAAIGGISNLIKAVSTGNVLAGLDGLGGILAAILGFSGVGAACGIS